jgi:cytochrome b
MVLLGDDAQLDARFGPFRDSSNLDARLLHGLCRTYQRLENHFGHNRWNSLVTWIMWNLVSVCLEIVLVSVQDRFMLNVP